MLVSVAQQSESAYTPTKMYLKKKKIHIERVRMKINDEHTKILMSLKKNVFK